MGKYNLEDVIIDNDNVLFHADGTGTGAFSGKLLTGEKAVKIVAIAEMGNAADLVLTVQTADDAAGTGAVDLSAVVPKWVNRVKQTDAKTHTVGDATGLFVIEWLIPANLIPTGKYLGLTYGNSNAANVLTAFIMEDSVHK